MEGMDELKSYIKRKQWSPDYRPLIYLPRGIEE